MIIDQDREKKLALTLMYLSIFSYIILESVKQNVTEKGKVRGP